MDAWTKKMRYIYTMEYYSAIKKNEIMPLSATWLDLEIIILSEVKSDRQRQISYDVAYIVESKTWYKQGTSSVVQWLSLHTPNAGAQVQSLVREPDPTGRN